MEDRNKILSRDKIIRVIQEAVVETFDLDEAVTNNDLSFKDDLDADSIDLVSLALVLEDEFSTGIEEDQIDNFTTINKVADYIVNKQREGSSFSSK